MTEIREAPVVIDPDHHEMFQLVERPVFAPHYCFVTLADSDEEGFVDTGNELPVVGPRGYVSVAGVRRLARFIGYQNPDLEALRGELDAANARILDLEAEVEKADLDLAAVDRLVRRQDGSWSPQRKPGRKPGDKTVAKNLPHLRDRDEDS